MKRFHVHVSVENHTLGSIPVYGEDTPVFNHGASAETTAPSVERASCCGE
jgi:hypothetical protein